MNMVIIFNIKAASSTPRSYYCIVSSMLVLSDNIIRTCIIIMVFIAIVVMLCFHRHIIFLTNIF